MTKTQKHYCLNGRVFDFQFMEWDDCYCKKAGENQNEA